MKKNRLMITLGVILLAVTLISGISWSGGISGGAGKSGDAPYLFNDTTVMFFNETLLNVTIDDRSGGGGSSSPWVSEPTKIYNATTGVNVGIGTDSPSHKLTVEGGINVSDNSNNIAIFFENGYLVVEG